MKSSLITAVVFLATVSAQAKVPVCVMGGDPVDKTFTWVPGPDWKMVKIDHPQEITETSGSGKEVTCQLPAGEVVAYPPTGGNPLVVLCKNEITKGKPTGTEIPRTPEKVVEKEKEVVRYVERPAPTSPPPAVSSQAPTPATPLTPVLAAAQPCFTASDVLEAEKIQKQKGRKANQTVKIRCGGLEVEIVNNNFKTSSGPSLGSILTGGPAYGYGGGYGNGSGYCGGTGCQYGPPPGMQVSAGTYAGYSH